MDRRHRQYSVCTASKLPPDHSVSKNKEKKIIINFTSLFKNVDSGAWYFNSRLDK